MKVKIIARKHIIPKSDVKYHMDFLLAYNRVCRYVEKTAHIMRELQIFGSHHQFGPHALRAQGYPSNIPRVSIKKPSFAYS